MFYFVYVLLSKKDNDFYIDFTTDLKQRIKIHQRGEVKSTKARLSLELIYFETYKNKLDAEKRERFLKSDSGHKYLKKQLENYLKFRKK